VFKGKEGTVYVTYPQMVQGKKTEIRGKKKREKGYMQ